jgi:hypothetical protein
VVDWNVHEAQKAPAQPRSFKRRVLIRSILRQGIRSRYRRAYWSFLFRSIRHWRANPQKMWMALTLLISGHHFIGYARQVTADLDDELDLLDRQAPAPGLALGAQAA